MVSFQVSLCAHVQLGRLRNALVIEGYRWSIGTGMTAVGSMNSTESAPTRIFAWDSGAEFFAEQWPHRRN